MKILVATDLSPASRTIETLKGRPWPAGTEVCVLHVVDLAPFEVGTELLETARRGAESVVKLIVGDLERSGLKAQAEVVVGHPRTAIPESAKKWGADFVVTGTHGAHGLPRLLLGSVAQVALRGSPCSVEIVRPGPKSSSGASPGWKILLATDGSDCARLAARSVVDRPWPSGTVVRILSVVPPFMPNIDTGMAYFETSQAAEVAQVVETQMRLHAIEVTAEAAKILQKAVVARIENAEPVSGDPKRVIVEEACKWGATMIVVGSHGRRGLDLLLTGSVSEFVAMHAHCSVEVIR